MNLELEIQNQTQIGNAPVKSSFVEWTKAALREERDQAELVIRIVAEQESQELNREYRGKDSPTNVLSFPSAVPAVVESYLLGDLVICAQLVVREAEEQGKSEQAHWAHMVVHGVLHLLGYDHQGDDHAKTMEQLEIEVLAGLGFQDPYKEGIDE